jgi:hypothetical protein
MSYATLMVYVDVEGKMDSRVSVAADLARRFDAHLIGIASGAPISAVLGEDAPNEAAAETRQLRDIKALLDEKAQQFRAAVGRATDVWNGDPSWDFRPMRSRARRGRPVSSSSAIPERAGIRSGRSIPGALSSRPAGRFWSCRLA